MVVTDQHSEEYVNFFQLHNFTSDHPFLFFFFFHFLFQNPLACAVATASLEVIVDEDLCNRAERLGNDMRKGLEELKGIGPSGGWITEVRGKGLLNAIVIDEKKSAKGRGAWDLCLLFKSHGLLAKPTHVNMYV